MMNEQSGRGGGGEQRVQLLEAEVERLRARLKEQRQTYEGQFEELEQGHAREIEELEHKHRRELQRHIDAFKETVLFHQQHQGSFTGLAEDAPAANANTSTIADLLSSATGALSADTSFSAQATEDAASLTRAARLEPPASGRVTAQHEQAHAGDEATPAGTTGTGSSWMLHEEIRALQERHDADMEHHAAELERVERHHAQLLGDETTRADGLQGEVDRLQQRLSLVDSALAAKQDELASVRESYEHEKQRRAETIRTLEAQLEDLGREQEAAKATRSSEFQRVLDEKAALNAQLSRANARVVQLQRMLKDQTLTSGATSVSASATGAHNSSLNTTLPTAQVQQAHPDTDAPQRLNQTIAGAVPSLSGAGRTEEGPAVAALARSHENRVRALLHDRQELLAELARLKEEMTQMHTSKTQLADDLTRGREELKQRHAKRVRELEEALQEKSTQLSSARATLAALEETLEQQYHTLIVADNDPLDDTLDADVRGGAAHIKSSQAQPHDTTAPVSNATTTPAAGRAALHHSFHGERELHTAAGGANTQQQQRGGRLWPGTSRVSSTLPVRGTNTGLRRTSATPQEQLLLVVQTLGRYKAALERLRTEHMQLWHAHQRGQQELASLRQHLSSYQTRCRDLTMQEQEQKSSLDTLQAHDDVLQRQKEELEEQSARLSRRVQTLTERVRELEGQVTQASAEGRQRLKESEAEGEKREEDLRRQLRAFQEELETSLGTKAALETQLSETLRQNMELKREKERLQQVAGQQEDRASRLQERHDFSLERAKKLEQELAAAKTEQETASEQLHILNQEAEALRSRVPNLERELQQAEEKRDSHREQAATLHSKVTTLYEQQTALKDAEAQLQDALIARDAAVGKASELNKEMQALRARTGAAEEEAQRTTQANKVVAEDLSRQLEVARARAANAEEATASLTEKTQALEAKMAKAHRELSLARDEAARAAAFGQTQEGQVAAKERQVATLQREVRELGERVQRLKVSNDQLQRDRRTHHTRLMEKMKRHFASQMTTLSALGKAGSGQRTPAPLATLQLEDVATATTTTTTGGKTSGKKAGTGKGGAEEVATREVAAEIQ